MDREQIKAKLAEAENGILQADLSYIRSDSIRSDYICAYLDAISNVADRLGIVLD